MKYHAYLRKATRFNKTHGLFHFRAPSRIFYKAVRGMVAHKTARGKAAMDRLKVFEGIPPPYDTKKRMVVPQALRILRLKPGRKYCTVGRLSQEFGWNYGDVVSRCVFTRCWKGLDRVILMLTVMSLQARGEAQDQVGGLLPEEEGLDQEAKRRLEGSEHEQGGAGQLRLLDRSHPAATYVECYS